jgi:hypothetical protein
MRAGFFQFRGAETLPWRELWKESVFRSRAFTRHVIVTISIVFLVCAVLAGVLAMFVIASRIDGWLASLSRT